MLQSLRFEQRSSTGLKAGFLFAGFLFTGVVAPAALAGVSGTDTNIGRYRLATGTSTIGDAVAQFVTDGKVGPENSWVTGTRGRHRLNLFFERDTLIGQIHVYSGSDRDGPVQDLAVQYRDDSGALVDVPGASVVNNGESALDIVFATPITTTQLQLAIDDQQTTIQEVAVFPPLATPAAIGESVNLHMARQHRVAMTTASSTASGSSRRAAVDGFVDDSAYWQSNGAANEWLAIDLQDPSETDPPTVRWSTTPVPVGSVHLYSGLASGAQPPVSRGRFQMLDNGVWVDIPGGGFANNTDPELVIQFDAPVTTAAMRLVVQSGPGVVREIVPLPPREGVVQDWPLGTSVIDGPATDALAYDDDFYGLRLDGAGLSLQTAEGGVPVLRASHDLLTQHYQVLLSVGTDTYRIRNRLTGRCLEPAGGSLADGAQVVEADFAGFPSQRWRIEESPSGISFVNSASGLVLTATSNADGATLVQTGAGVGPQTWSPEVIDHAPKKGTGGFPQLSETFGNAWAYNWGPDDTFPNSVDFWPMQWGSFNWSQRPSLNPAWQRNGEPIVLMGYNEPDKVDQSNMPVSTAAGMWPRLETLGLPLLGPAVAGHPATDQWIQDFMAVAAAEEFRVDYVGMHSYGGPNANSFINKITDAHNAWDRDVVVSEFSVVDWSNTNSWDNEPVYNWFAEVLWRMERLDYLHRYAVFIFTDDPANPISDNRGEMLNADGTLTPAGKLYAAWDGDLQIRTDTPYHLHNNASHNRIGSVAGQSGTASTTLGRRADDGAPFRWRLVPGSASDLVHIESVDDGRFMAFTSRGLELIDTPTEGMIDEFRIQEIEHGWFAIIEPGLNRRLSNSGSTISLASSSSTAGSVRWRFVPVFGGVPGPVRGGQAISLGGGDVLLGWDPHGFRDLVGFTISRQGPGGGAPEVVAVDLAGESFVDRVPEPGTYVYTITAVGDTGVSEVATLGTVGVEACPGDFNADFIFDEADIQAAITAIEGGFDFDGSGSADFFDFLAFLRAFDEGCDGN